MKETRNWVLWKVRNSRIFKGINHEIDEIVEEIKVLAWQWKLKRMQNPVCMGS